MEDIVKEPIHIEFYGLPGCGKSTVSHKVANQLKTLGYTVYEPSYESDHKLRPIIRKFRKLFLTIKFRVLYGKEYKKLQRIIIKNGYRTFRSNLKQMVNIIPKIIVYKNTTPGYYLWDEGLIQSSISLTINHDVSIENTRKSIVLKNKKVITIFLKTDINTALNRMSLRNTNDSRVEQEVDDNKKRKMMQDYYLACEKLKSDIIIESDIVNDAVQKIVIALTL